jgi:DMSO/TMAO reductase YedYZ molybdopterin-dependent catalytic subunit
MGAMTTRRGAWALAGLAAGAAGLAVSYAVANVMAIRSSPVVAVAELVIELTPGEVVEQAIAVLGFQDKTVLLALILVFLAGLFVLAGRLAARRWWAPTIVFAALGAIGVVAVAVTESPSPTAYLPIGAGFVTWLVVLGLLADRLRADGDRTQEEGGADSTAGTRRGFLLGAGSVAAISLGLAALGRVWGTGRRRVEEARRLLRIPGVTEPRVPGSARVGLDGVSPWQTSEDDFYLIHTAIALPTIAPEDWRLRIHGLVDREITLGYQDLLDRARTEAWITLNCVSNPVGGELIGNAWWSGVRVADLLREVGVSPDADAVLQTSEDGWTCGTPLSALTDDRDAMLVLAMNGRPLPVEHGFPVRTLVPGLYGFVSACKWVVDWEVTRFDRIEAYWTGKGWAEQAPVKLGSRIDVPGSGEKVPVGAVRLGGVAWQQHTGVRGVEISLDGGEWTSADVAGAPSEDTWVQWAGTVTVGRGDHVVRVRATSGTGEVQTGTQRDVLPDGATGWDSVEFSAG